ncbi:alpha/beta hydrolase [Hymenobacter siberiensis]|uniref:alpha/beta hydrolase n=1 Tax=Hymenobacter siberiensis TaxID=2848396 RepID=UPI001C1E08D7|nr:alpha/beta hydrolase [Hymenobacter siberiensis]
MIRKLLRNAGKMVIGVGLWPAAVLGQASAPIRPDSAAQHSAAPVASMPSVAGVWKGPLSIPGGTLPIQISIIQPGANKLIATLDLPAKRLNKVPASLTLRGDTLIFYAATVDCRFVCIQAGEAGQELRGMWLQPGLRVPLVLQRADPNGAGTVTVEKTAAVKATTYHIEAVHLTSQPGNVALAGTLSIPDGAGPFPAAVLLTDMGSQDRDSRQGSYRFFADIAATLARQGIAVLRLDDRGVGESGGNGPLATTADLVRDAQAGLGYLRIRPSIDPARTGLIGHGEGGNVALLAAAQPVPPGFVVALAASGLVGLDLLASQAEPLSAADTVRTGEARRQAWAEVLAKAAKLRASGSNSAQVETYVAQQRLKIKSEERKQAETTLKFRRTMLEIVRQTASNDQAQAIVVNMLHQRYPNQDPALARARATDLLTPWYRYYLKFDPQPGLADVQCPVLLLNGTDDAEVNAATNLTALEKGLKGNKRVSARRLPGLNHWFQTPAAERIAAADGTVESVVAPVLLTAVRDWVLQQGSR